MALVRLVIVTVCRRGDVRSRSESIPPVEFVQLTLDRESSPVLVTSSVYVRGPAA
jgi:hypothetical protein